ncbi:hypothetical protein SLS60_000793 [Paraconiothyrium brasiliense]|uniref:Uncharacterized protein n=1 Tax=Paraconiothyrium brasiliense TaxID=300254 RepID=A0ABR3S794_9PLEO
MPYILTKGGSLSDTNYNLKELLHYVTIRVLLPSLQPGFKYGERSGGKLIQENIVITIRAVTHAGHVEGPYHRSNNLIRSLLPHNPTLFKPGHKPPDVYRIIWDREVPVRVSAHVAETRAEVVKNVEAYNSCITLKERVPEQRGVAKGAPQPLVDILETGLSGLPASKEDWEEPTLPV